MATWTADRRAEISAHLAECAACAGEGAAICAALSPDLGRPASRPRIAVDVRRARAGGRARAGRRRVTLIVCDGHAAPHRHARKTPRASRWRRRTRARVHDALESGRLSLPSSLSELSGRHGDRCWDDRGAGVSPDSTDRDGGARHAADPAMDASPWSSLTYIVTLQDQSTERNRSPVRRCSARNGLRSARSRGADVRVAGRRIGRRKRTRRAAAARSARRGS